MCIRDRYERAEVVYLLCLDAKGGIRMQSADLETFYATLPFSPTGAQRRAVAAAVLLFTTVASSDLPPGPTSVPISAFRSEM